VGNINVDLWQTFDFATLNAANLDANDNFATTGLWSVTNNHGTMTAGSEQLLPGTINTSLTDAAGSKGLTVDCNFNGGATIAAFNLAGTGGPGAKNILTFGFWIRMPAAWAGSFHEQDVIRIENVLGSKQLYVKASDHADAGNTTKFHIFNETDGYGPGVAVSAATWYWVTGSYDGSAISATGGKVKIYDTTGALVGAEQTTATIAQPATQVTFGPIVGNSGAFVGNMDLDDLLLDWTGHVYPLGPGAASAVVAASRAYEDIQRVRR
jgi:hypothetical protein